MASPESCLGNVLHSVSGVLNLYVAFTFSQQTWVTFKVFGLFGLTIVFAGSQMILAQPLYQE